MTGSAALNLGFPGQWFQLETGLHYNWHRHYDPTKGRYIQADPLGMPDGPSRYAYVANSPLMYTDPTGEQSSILRPNPTFNPNAPGKTFNPNLNFPLFIDTPFGSVPTLPGAFRVCSILLDDLMNPALNSDDAGDGTENPPTGPGEGTPTSNPDGWDEVPQRGRPSIFVPAGGKEPVLQGDRGNPHGGGEQYKKWKKRRDFNKGKPRDSTVNELGDKIRR